MIDPSGKQSRRVAREKSERDRRERLHRGQAGRLIRESKQATDAQIRKAFALTHELERFRPAIAARLRRMLRNNELRTHDAVSSVIDAVNAALERIRVEDVTNAEIETEEG